MQIPLVENIRELDHAPARFLKFTAINVISWQCTVGPAMILLARKIDMPPAWVGWLIAFMPLSMLLVVGTVPLVLRLGPKRLMMAAWMTRNILTCGVFVMPLLIAKWGNESAWYLLLLTTLGFCLARAMGAGGWFPWLHEVVPSHQRGPFFSAEASLAQIISVIIIVSQALILIGDPGIERYLSIYAIGVLTGLVSVVWMYRVPGGGGAATEINFVSSFYEYRIALQDRPYMIFIMVTVLSFSALAWLGSGMVMYMRDILGLSSNAIMFITASGSLGVFLTIRFWERFAEHSGSAMAIYKTLTAHSLVALACLLLWPGAPWTIFLLVAIIMMGGIFAAAFWMLLHRAMLGYVQLEGRVGYTNIWTLGTAVALGVTPILAGLVIQNFGMNGFRTCFLISGVGGLLCAIACLKTVHDSVPIERNAPQLFNAAFPVRTLFRIAWITLGLHESNKKRKDTPA